ncbi:MAG: hypothetical protein HFG40_00840 [Bacilli bacterium]|nr:hypothetical protein [Bacilli bacterium]
MELEDLNKKYDRLQKKYGAKDLNSIYNGGLEKNPDICFVFMNPTARNIASTKEWRGRRSPWIGTKNIWDLFYAVDLIDEDLYFEIKRKKGNEWTEEFADLVYDNVKKYKYFITNLGKCTQIDARPLPDAVYMEYLNLLYQEFQILKPKVIILFGNQVSSIVLGQKISVSEARKKCYEKKIKNVTYKFYSVYYPIGNGRFNIDKSIEDIRWIMKRELVDHSDCVNS